jgi:hypothetical protein
MKKLFCDTAALYHQACPKAKTPPMFVYMDSVFITFMKTKAQEIFKLTQHFFQVIEAIGNILQWLRRLVLLHEKVFHS